MLQLLLVLADSFSVDVDETDPIHGSTPFRRLLFMTPGHTSCSHTCTCRASRPPARRRTTVHARSISPCESLDHRHPLSRNPEKRKKLFPSSALRCRRCFRFRFRCCCCCLCCCAGASSLQLPTPPQPSRQATATGKALFFVAFFHFPTWSSFSLRDCQA